LIAYLRQTTGIGQAQAFLSLNPNRLRFCLD
jgi:hypothetical protein